MIESNGYESPILMTIKKTCEDILEERDNAIEAKIIEEIGLDINKEELLKALAYDRDQYNKGYRKGYIDGEIAGYKQGYDDALEKVQSKLKELIWPEKEEKDDA